MTIHVSQRDEITVVVGEGDVDLVAIREAFEGIRAATAPGARARILIEDEGSSFAPFTAELKELIGVLGAIFEGVDTRLAVKVGRPVQYGVGRMFEARSEGAGFAARVFREHEEDEAIHWLRTGPADDDG